MSTYKPTSGRGEPLEYHYSTFEGEARKALVGVDSIDMTNAWSVYDVPAAAGNHTHGWLVERLDGHDDKLGEATFLAAEYAADQQRFHDSERGEQSIPDPLPRPVVDSDGHRQPVTVPLGEIRKHAALARQRANCDRQPIAA
jgi:hypothetical protein